MRLARPIPIGLALLLCTTCGGSEDLKPSIETVAPGEFYVEDPVRLTIAGRMLRPRLTVDTSSGEVRADVTGFSARLLPSADGGPDGGSSGAPPAPVRLTEVLLVMDAEGCPTADPCLTATVPEGLAEGWYDLEVRDSRGETGLRVQAVHSLGADGEVPQVAIEAPINNTSFCCAGMPLRISGSARDTPGRLDSVRWTVRSATALLHEGTCPIDPDNPGESVCSAEVIVATPSMHQEPIEISIEARDRAGLQRTVRSDVKIALKPEILSVTPDPLSGPSDMSTLFIVKGTNFVPDMKLLVGGVVARDIASTVDVARGWAPPHDPGVVDVEIAIGSFRMPIGRQFEYFQRPVLRMISPSSGPEAGETRVVIAGSNFREGQTRIFFGTRADYRDLQRVRFVSSTRLEGYTPPGTGTVSVWAKDSGPEYVELPNAFTYR